MKELKNWRMYPLLARNSLPAVSGVISNQKGMIMLFNQRFADF